MCEQDLDPTECIKCGTIRQVNMHTGEWYCPECDVYGSEKLIVVHLSKPADIQYVNEITKRHIGNMMFADKLEATAEGTSDLGICRVSFGVWTDVISDRKVTMHSISNCFKGLLISGSDRNSVLILPSREKMDLLLRDKIEDWERAHREAKQ